MENRFSKEFLFKKMNLEHHCVGIIFKTPKTIDEKSVEEIFGMELVVSETEGQQLIENIAKIENTYGLMRIKYFIKSEELHNPYEMNIDTSEIDEIEMVARN